MIIEINEQNTVQIHQTSLIRMKILIVKKKKLFENNVK